MADDSWTVLKVLRWTQGRFGERGLRTPRLDAELLLAHALHLDRIGLYTHYDQPLGRDELSACRELIKRRLTGEPVAYLVGRQEFWSLPLAVDRRVLVPRPETETLVEKAIEWLRGRPGPRVADVGTGSGAVAIAVAHERPDAFVFAVDRSDAALAVARENVAATGVEVELLAGDLVDPLIPHAPLDALLSNPPYVADGDWPTLPAEVRCEPREALLGGADGLDVIRRLAAAAPRVLAPGGLLALEVGAGQAPSVCQLVERAGFAAVGTRRDLAGIERVVFGERLPIDR